jgi:hypothetical protein
MVLVFFLGTCSFAYGQAKEPATTLPATATTPMEKLFAITDILIAKSKTVCKSDDCTAALAQLSDLLADARDKYSKNVLTGDERKQFHENYRGIVRRLQDAITAQIRQEPDGVAKLQEMKTDLARCQTKFAQSNNCSGHLLLAAAQNPSGYPCCSQCTSVLETSLAICTLYEIANPLAAALCYAAVAYGYSQCVQQCCEAYQG